jgi:NitT/TauT family transport system substrate-binding protein
MTRVNLKLDKNLWKRFITLFISILFLTACNLTSLTSSKQWPKLRIGYLPVAAELPLFVAVEKGYFKEANIDFELTRLASSNDMGNAATADKIDILAGAASNVVFDIGHVSGKKHLAFAVNPYSNTPGHITDQLIARKGLNIKNLTDVKGKKVASFPGSVNRIFTYLILEKYGLPRDSYQYSELLPKDWQPSLQSGAIDVVSALEPQATQIIKDGAGDSIFRGFYADLMPDVPLSGHWIAANYYARADKKQLAAFLDAYEKAIQFCRQNEKEAKKYLIKYANVREDILAAVNLNPWKKLSEIDAKKFQEYIDLLAKNKALLAKVDIKGYLLPDPRPQ